MGELRISGSGNDAAINSFLKDKPGIAQSYARLALGAEFDQMGKDAQITDKAYAAAYATGNDEFITQVVNNIIASQIHSTSTSVHNGEITMLFDGKTSAARMAWLKEIFNDKAALG